MLRVTRHRLKPVLLLLLSCSAFAAQKFDVVIYGGTAGGVIAAVSSAREGLKTALIEPGHHLGGMVSGGLSDTDFGKKEVIGGYALEFYKRVAQHYQLSRYGVTVAWYHEPHVAEDIFRQMLKDAHVTVFENHPLREKNAVRKEGGKLVEIALDNGDTYLAGIFMDSSYEGDLMAQAGVSTPTAVKALHNTMNRWRACGARRRSTSSWSTSRRMTINIVSCRRSRPGTLLAGRDRTKCEAARARRAAPRAPAPRCRARRSPPAPARAFARARLRRRRRRRTPRGNASGPTGDGISTTGGFEPRGPTDPPPRAELASTTTPVATGISAKAARLRLRPAGRRGGVVEDIVYRDIQVENVSRAIELDLQWRMVPPLAPRARELTVLRNVKIINLTGTAQSVGLIRGFKEAPIKDIGFEHCQVTAQHGLAVANARTWIRPASNSRWPRVRRSYAR